MKDYQREFIRFLIDAEALLFGEFTLKSGRKAPFFFNSGKFNSGEKIERLGGFYADHIQHSGLHTKTDVIFGPAYKGIPLAVIASSALYRKCGADLGFAFDRKEAKDHGDIGNFVGAKLSPGTRLLVIEDVITAGTTIKALVESLKALDSVSIGGMVISLDRCERGAGEFSAAQEVKTTYGFEVSAIIKIYDVLQYLEETPNAVGPNQAQLIENSKKYLAEYGAKL